MGKYIVTTGQNIYDVALHIYGSIQGVVDLMMNNNTLSFATKLQQGDELIYTDDFIIDAEVVAYNQLNGIIPANGERNVYFKNPAYPKLFEIVLSPTLISAGLEVDGDCVFQVDWGDNSILLDIELDADNQIYNHSFDNTVAKKRTLKIYGSGILQLLDLSNLNPKRVILLEPISVDKLIFNDCECEISFIQMMTNVREVDLSGTKLNSLLPLISQRGLRKVELSHINILNEKIDEYLIELVNKNYGRKPCQIILTEEPSGIYQEPERDENLDYVITTGMEAIWLLTNEPTWNQNGFWEIVTKNNTYTYKPYP